MLGKLLIIAICAVALGRPQDGDNEVASAHNLCPDDEVHHLLPHEYDCTKFYYCEYGLKWETPRDCAPGTEFSYQLQVCIHPVQANCTLPGVPPPVEESPGEPDLVDPESVEPEVEAPDANEPEPDVEEPEVETPDETQPEPEPDLEEPEVETPDETQPEPDLEEPEVEEPVEVEPQPEEGGSFAPDSETDPDANEKPEVENPGNVDPESNSGEENAKDWLENGCPADIHVHWLLPHESDCGKFYYCVFGEKEERSCSGGLHFNPELQVCDWPENVGCANAGETEVEKPGVDEPEVEEPEVVEPGTVDPASNSGEENVTEWLDNGCPADIHVHWLLPHESDCGKFYYCVFGEKEERSCSGGLHFNPELQVCDWPENVGCANAGETEVEEPGVDEPEVEEPEVVEPGTVDPESNSGEEKVTEWLDNGCPADIHVHWLLPHESDCGKFYYCVFGEKEERSCSGGLHFNPELQVCDWPENAGCANAGETEVEEPGVDEPEVEEPEVVEPGTVDPESNSGEENVTEWLENGCPDDIHVHWLLPHESDCGKFYYCVFGEKKESSCSGGLHFNPVLQVCDWPENAACANTGEPEVVDPEEPEVVDPQEPEIVDPQEPELVDPQEPEVVDPEGPEVVDPEEPEVVDPAEPEVVNPEVDNRCVDACNIKPWPHVTDCDKYWRCEGDKPILVICSEGLQFNSKTGSCDYSCNAGCIRDHVQTTANREGLKIFVPWQKVNDNMKKTLPMIYL